MNKSLNRLNRQFGQNIKNTLVENELQNRLNLKPKCRKAPENVQKPQKQHRHEMGYSDEILKYALTTITYPHILKGPQKVKRDIESLLFEVTSINGQNCLWHEDYLTLEKNKKYPFYNSSITLEKRATLLDWLIAIHNKYTLREQTLHLTIKLIDNHCIKNDIPLKKYQLIAVAAFFIAAKFEETELPKFKDYYRLLTDRYSEDEMRLAETQILCKTQFLLTKKISTLWYLEAFALEDILFGSRVRYSSDLTTANKQNISQQVGLNNSSSRFREFMRFCNCVLNLILVDYKLSVRFKEDIIAISTVVFATYQLEFADSDGRAVLDNFVTTKERLVEGNQSGGQITKEVKRCMKGIQQLYAKRGEQRFKAVREKFDKKCDQK